MVYSVSSLYLIYNLYDRGQEQLNKLSIALISSKEKVCERSQKCADATIKTEQLASDVKNNQTDNHSNLQSAFDFICIL